MLPGVARVVHSKASCTVHWLESGKNRPNAKELPAAQILGIQSLKAASKSGRGGSQTAQGDVPRPETLLPEPLQDGSAKPEEKKASEQNVRTAEPPGYAASPADGCAAPAPTRSVDVLFDGPPEPCREEHNSGLSSPESGNTPPGKCALGSSEDMAPAVPGPTPTAKERPVEQIREEGWSGREADGVTLAELYLMFGKPGKLQLEYEWQPAAAAPTEQLPSRNGKAHPVLRCLLKLVTTEVNPKPLVGAQHSLSLFLPLC